MQGTPGVLIAQLETEWQGIAESEAAVSALRRAARRDPLLKALVVGRDAPYPTPGSLLASMRAAKGAAQRADAARHIAVLLREAPSDPFIGRFLLQALLPGLVVVAKKLQFGQGGEWADATEFFAELLSVTWGVIDEWAGEWRPYAAGDLLSAIRMRLRRQLFKAKERRMHTTSLEIHSDVDVVAASETIAEELARALIELHADPKAAEGAEVVYANAVLGYTIGEIADRRGAARRRITRARDRARVQLSR